MNLQPRMHTAIALVAAYAVALQALLLVVVVPPGAADGIAALPICANAARHIGDVAALGGHSAPGSHGQDCIDACLTGCCCGAPVLPAPAQAVRDAPARSPLVAASGEEREFVIRFAAAHRSRAPPRA